MKSNHIGHISEAELDGLLGEAFLNLDFENNPDDSKVLDFVTKEVMFSSFLSRIFKGHRLDLLFLLLSIIVCLSSMLRYMQLQVDPESKNILPVLSITKPALSSPMHQEKKDGTKLTATFKSVNNISPEITKLQSTKNKNKRLSKKNLNPVIPVTPNGITSDDSQSVFKNRILETKQVDSVNTQPLYSSVGSLRYTPSPAPVSTSRKFKPETKTYTSKAEKRKIKKEKRRKRRQLHRDGTFVMKGNKYRKSRQH